MLSIAFFSFNLMALWTVLRGREIKFQVTPKERNNQRHMALVAPQICVVVTVFAITYALGKAWINPGAADLGLLAVNVFWSGINAYCMTILINAALWTPGDETAHRIDVKNRITKGKLV